MDVLYARMGLTPYRSVFIHLLFIGIPFRFGLLPTGWGRFLRPVVPARLIGEPCSIFRHDECTDAELFSLHDVGIRFVILYELAWVVGIVMRNTASINAIAFHKQLLGTSAGTIILLSYWTNHGVLTGRKGPFHPHFSSSLIGCYSVACAISVWTILIHPPSFTESVKWSIPANSIFWGGVVNVFVAVAAVQTMWTEGGVEQMYRDTVTKRIRLTFFVSALLTFLHGVLLLRIRTFLSVSQLRTICLYKLIVNLVLPWFWMPELSQYVAVNTRLMMAVRLSVILSYCFGYWWAGTAEGVSRILTSEKED